MTIVAEFMKREPLVRVKPEATIREASKAMVEHGVGSVLVVGDGDRLIGIFTERDLARAVARGCDPDEGRVSDYMTRNPITARPEEPLVMAGHKMIEHGIRHLPVVDGMGRLIGVISMRDVLRALFSQSEFP